MKFFGKAIVASLLAIASGVWAQSPLASYEGADRMDRIVAAARKEGTLTLYTTIAEKDLPTLIKPFETKYGITVKVWRAGTDKILQRSLAEYTAKRYEVDAIHFGSPEMEALAREKVLLAVKSPVYKDLLPGSVPPHQQWAATLLSVWVQAYNTNIIKKEDLPRTYADLLNPKWKGKLGLEAKNQDWFQSVVEIMGGGDKGLKFFNDLMAVNGVSPRTGHTLLTNLVVSGEVPMALSVYNYMPEQAKKKGAPIDWFALEPAVARSNAVGVATKAPHPAAALLFHQFMLTRGAVADDDHRLRADQRHRAIAAERREDHDDRPHQVAGRSRKVEQDLRRHRHQEGRQMTSCAARTPESS